MPNDAIEKMVFFVLTREGLEKLRYCIGRMPSPVWVNEGVLSVEAIDAFRKDGVEISHFVRYIDPYDELKVADGISTIQDHHAGSIVWVERPALSNSRFDADGKAAGQPGR